VTIATYLHFANK